MCFIISNDIYMAHHNLLGIHVCHQLKIRHFYGTFNFSTHCICLGTGSLFVYGFHGFRGKARPLRRKTAFAVASIVFQLLSCYVFCYYRTHNIASRKQSRINHKFRKFVGSKISQRYGPSYNRPVAHMDLAAIQLPEHEVLEIGDGV